MAGPQKPILRLARNLSTQTRHAHSITYVEQGEPESHPPIEL